MHIHTDAYVYTMDEDRHTHTHQRRQTYIHTQADKYRDTDTLTDMHSAHTYIH